MKLLERLTRPLAIRVEPRVMTTAHMPLDGRVKQEFLAQHRKHDQIFVALTRLSPELLPQARLLCEAEAALQPSRVRV